MRIKDFNCCGTNEFLISRSQAKQMVKGFRNDLANGLVDYKETFGFCISCGSEFTFLDAVNEKGFEIAMTFYENQMKISTVQTFSHKIRKNGGPSKNLLKILENNQAVDSRMMKRFYDKRIEAISKINGGD